MPSQLLRPVVDYPSFAPALPLKPGLPLGRQVDLNRIPSRLASDRCNSSSTSTRTSPPIGCVKSEHVATCPPFVIVHISMTRFGRSSYGGRRMLQRSLIYAAPTRPALR